MAYVPFVIFFLSGAAALVFETLWFRLAGLAFGNSIWSATLVLAAFMGGLSLGTGVLTFFGHRLRISLKLFAWIEISVGISGLAVVFFLPQISALLAMFFQTQLDNTLVLNLIRFSIAFAVLLVPTFAMGMTLPALVTALSRVNGNYGQVLGRLYGWNTVGAVIGALIGEMVLIRWYGLTGTGVFAAGLNLVAAMLALRLHSRLKAQDEPVPATPRPIRLNRNMLRLLFSAFFLGFLMLALEVIWFRLLLLFQSSTSLTFATMLAVVLFGISVGGLIASLLYRKQMSPHRYNREFTMLTGILVVAPFLLTIGFVWPLVNVNSWMIFTALCSLVVLPSTILSGLLFTTLGKALNSDLTSTTRSTGLLVLFNTLGATAGVLVGTLVLLPELGILNSITVIGIGYGVVVWLLPAPDRLSKRGKPAGRWALIMLSAVLLVIAAGSTKATMRPLYSNYYVNTDHRTKTEIVGFHEGLTETILYHRVSLFGETKFHRLITNGYSMSATTKFGKRFMKLYVYLPMIFHPNIKNALLISYGVGSTAKALTDSATIETIDMVDTSRDILDMSTVVFPDPKENPLNDDRVSVYIEDGRFYLATTSDRYDLITADPPPPKNAGIVNLYTQEYFELIYQRLAEGGMATYWLPVFTFSDSDAQAVIKAFCNSFDHCSLWAGAALNWVMVGIRGEYPAVSADHFRAQWEDPKVGAELRSLGFESPEQFASLFMADDSDLAAFTSEKQPLTDDYPLRLSNALSPAKTFGLLPHLADARQSRQRFLQSGFYTRIWPPEIAQKSLKHFETQRILNDLLMTQQKGNRWENLVVLLTKTDLKTMPLWALGGDYRTLEIIDKLMEQGQQDTRFLIHLAYREMIERNYESAATLMADYMKKAENLEKSVTLQYVVALCLQGDRQAATAAFENTRPLDDEDVEWAEFNAWFPTGCVPGKDEPTRHSRDGQSLKDGFETGVQTPSSGS